MTRATPSSSSASATWTSYIREQWFYHNSDDPSQYKQGSDAPVMRRINTTGNVDANGNSIFDTTQNFVTDRQGSVVAILGAATAVDPNNESLGGKPGPVVAYVRYDTYGTPIISDPADINRDGRVDASDAAAYIQYWQAYHANTANSYRYKEILDFDKDGTVATHSGDTATAPDPNNADFHALSDRILAAQVEVPVAEKLGNLPLYCGYWWDADIEMYHVRHRVYRPQWGKWVQRDPLGYLAGWNSYEYVGGEPWREFDPLGLNPFEQYVTDFINGYHELVEQLTDTAQQVHDSVVNYYGEFSNGVVELVEYWSSAPSIDQIYTDAGDKEARREAHKVLRNARDAAAFAGPFGRAAFHIMNIVDLMLGAFDQVVDATPSSSSGVGPYSPGPKGFINALVRLAEAIGQAMAESDNSSCGDDDADSNESPRETPYHDPEQPGYSNGETHKDHIHARSLGGSDEDENLQDLAGETNMRKGGLEGELKSYEEFLIANGMDPADARKVIEDEIRSLGNSPPPRPMDPFDLDQLPWDPRDQWRPR